ncbi:unnamed protein product [Choristocarpus tenellus]
MILGFIVLGLSFITPLFRIKGYASIFGDAKGEPDSVAEI